MRETQLINAEQLKRPAFTAIIYGNLVSRVLPLVSERDATMPLIKPQRRAIGTTA